jgi:hypothetical protein
MSVPPAHLVAPSSIKPPAWPLARAASFRLLSAPDHDRALGRSGNAISIRHPPGAVRPAAPAAGLSTSATRATSWPHARPAVLAPSPWVPSYARRSRKPRQPFGRSAGPRPTASRCARIAHTRPCGTAPQGERCPALALQGVRQVFLRHFRSPVRPTQNAAAELPCGNRCVLQRSGE